MNSLFNFISNLISKIIEARRVNPHLKVGVTFIGFGMAGVSGGLIGKFFFSNESIKILIEIDGGVSSIIILLSLFLFILGVYLCIKGLNNTKRTWENKIFYYLKGLENQRDEPPFKALPKMAKWYPPHPVTFEVKGNSPSDMLDDLKFKIRNITEKIDQRATSEVFFAGLARVPYLFFIGYAFRNAHSSITLLEHIHQTTKWQALKDIDDSYIKTKIQNEMEEENFCSNISVIIEFTCEIPTSDLPENLKTNVIRVKLDTPFSHNQIMSQKTLNRITDEIIQVLIKINKQCDTMHLFIAAQSTLVFSLGRRYQDGMIGNVWIYKYDPIRKGYPWAFGLEHGEIKLNGMIDQN